MVSWHVAQQVWHELEFAFVVAFIVSCELLRLGWQETGCPLSQPGLLCFKEVGCLGCTCFISPYLQPRCKHP